MEEKGRRVWKDGIFHGEVVGVSCLTFPFVSAFARSCTLNDLNMVDRVIFCE